MNEWEELNNKILNCRKCHLHETRNIPIIGEGNKNSKFMIIAQAPGRVENKKEKMFVGPSGKFLREIFENIDLDFNSIYKTNLIKCFIPHCKRPNLKMINSCKPYLLKEIMLINPDYIFTLGYYATREVFNYFNINMNNRADFKNNFGKLFWSNNIKLVPFPHPASAIYNEEYKEGTKKFYEKINIITRTCKWFKICPIKRFYEKGKLERKWIELYCKGDWHSCKRFQMEENGQFHPNNMLPDGTIDESLE